MYRRWTFIRQQKFNTGHPDHVWARDLECYHCDDFLTFSDWLHTEIGLPGAKQKLHRPNRDLGWIPGNVRWATTKEVALCYQRNILVTYQGRTQHLTAWCRELNLNYGTVFSRYHRGWPTRQMFTHPVLSGQKTFFGVRPCL